MQLEYSDLVVVLRLALCCIPQCRLLFPLVLLLRSNLRHSILG